MHRPATAILLAALACSLSAAAAGPRERLMDLPPAQRQEAIAERVPAVADALAACEAGTWKQIGWQTDPAAALAAARERGLPLLVFVYKTVAGDPPAAGEPEGEGLTCLGARVTRGLAFSDPTVIAQIRAGFVPLQLDVAAGGLSDALPGLRRVERVHERIRGDGDGGFSASVVLAPDGERVLASSLKRPGARVERRERGDHAAESSLRSRGGAIARELEKSSPEAYLQMLKRATEALRAPQK